jgi:hypothetical protein
MFSFELTRDSLILFFLLLVMVGNFSYADLAYGGDIRYLPAGVIGFAFLLLWLGRMLDRWLY